MADQFDNNARSPNPDAEIDDPLAELARIIGYERPSGDAATTEGASDSSEFDLEAELMRELDVPLAPSIDELDRIEADEALDVILAEAPFEPQPDPEPEVELEAGPDDAEGADDAFAYLTDGFQGDEAQDAGNVDPAPVEGRSSESLLKAIENEFPAEPEERAAADLLAGEDDHWFVSSEPEELPAQQPAAPDEQPGYEEYTPQPLTEAAVKAEDNGQPAYPAGPIDDQVLADMAQFELSSKASRDPQGPVSTQNVADSGAGSGVGSVDTSREAALDFEEYLSTELDVFEQEFSMGGDDGVSDTPQQPPVQDAAPQFSDADDHFDVGNALEALNDSTLDDDVTVFDDAAEELLAAINDDVEFSGRSAAAGEAPDDWSIESIEEGAAEELDAELGDMFGLPERSADPVAARTDAGEDLEFDLEKILADSFDGDDDWAEPVEIEPEIEAVAAVENDDWLSSYPSDDQPPQRDELTEAFQGLLPDEEPHISQAAMAAMPENTGDAGGNPAGQGDWLAGFDAAEQTGNEASGRSPSSDYYFDADLISEPDETVEIVPDIDVPELEHQEPQTVDPDYDIEIEREFADIIDRNEPSADSLPVDGGGAVFAAAEGWSRDTATPRGYEVSDDYIALERELGSGVERTNFAATATADLIGDRLSDTDALDNGLAEADNRSRGPMVAVALLALAVVAGIGGFGWSMLSGGDSTTADGGPRIIRADKEPVKVLPENPGGVTVPNQDKAVYDRVAGGSESSTGQPALVNSAEEPVDVVQRTLDPEILPLEGRTDFSVKSEERLSAEANGEETAEGGAPAPVVSPRKVRTMIVKPDGSIVAREVSEPETTAPQTSEAAPQALAAASSQDAAAAVPVAGGEAAETAASTETQAESQEQAAATETPATEGTLAPVRVVTTQPIRPVANAPVPQGRPADQPVNVVGTVSQAGRVGAAPATTTAPTATAAPVAPAPVAPAPVEVASAPQAAAPAANPGGYYVQIASQPTVEGAQASWQTLSNRYSSVLGGRGVDIQRADIPGKGVFHRVRVPAGTRDQANALCTRYKAAGGSCFVSR